MKRAYVYTRIFYRRHLLEMILGLSCAMMIWPFVFEMARALQKAV